MDKLERLPFRVVYGDVWCKTCEHAHIPDIPTVTLKCADCGFGVWPEFLHLAVMHASSYPEHNVYALHHETVELK